MKRQAKLLIILVLRVVLNLVYSFEDDDDDDDRLSGEFWKRNEKNNLASSLKYRGFSKGKGKSGGARLITYVKVTETTIYLTSIFDKSEKENITDNELKAILKLLK